MPPTGSLFTGPGYRHYCHAPTPGLRVPRMRAVGCGLDETPGSGWNQPNQTVFTLWIIFFAEPEVG